MPSATSSTLKRAGPLADLQQEDLVQFGKVILSLANNTPPNQLINLGAAVEQLARTYSPELKQLVSWLVMPPQPDDLDDAQQQQLLLADEPDSVQQGLLALPPRHKTIDVVVQAISQRIVSSFDAALHYSDSLYSEVFREVENGRAARLMMKLSIITERENVDGDAKWAEHGERYQLKLFRDHVFHSVDADGRPIIDIAHMLRCLARLDAGSADLVRLTSRDGETDFMVSYKELQKMISGAFGAIVKASRSGNQSL